MQDCWFTLIIIIYYDHFPPLPHLAEAAAELWNACWQLRTAGALGEAPPEQHIKAGGAARSWGDLALSLLMSTPWGFQWGWGMLHHCLLHSGSECAPLGLRSTPGRGGPTLSAAASACLCILSNYCLMQNA